MSFCLRKGIKENEMMKQKLAVCLFTLSLLILTACGTGGTATPENTPIPTVIADKVIIADGRIEPVRYAEMAFNGSGLVGEVLVVEGEHVETGQVLARLENSEALQAEVARTEEAFLLAEQSFSSAEAEVLLNLADAHEAIRLAQNKLDNFYISTNLKEMGPNEAMQFTLDQYNTAREEYEPYKNWSPNDKTRRLYKRTLDDAWADYRRTIDWAELVSDLEAAQINLKTAQREADSLTGTDESSLARARYETARANLEAARAALADVELRAPFDGTVAGLNVRVGETVSAGQSIVSIADFSSWIVKTTDLTEIDVVKIAEGQPVTVSLDAIPDANLVGTVESIGETFTERQGDVVYEVTVGLAETLPNMRWGMTATVRFSE